MLDDLLQYRSMPESSGFVDEVMRAVGRQQQLRRRILLFCGFIGAVFGTLGAWLLADSLARISTDLFAANSALASGTIVVLLLALLAWLFHEEQSLTL
jgi:hypothetical protein